MPRTAFVCLPVCLNECFVLTSHGGFTIIQITVPNFDETPGKEGTMLEVLLALAIFVAPLLAIVFVANKVAQSIYDKTGYNGFTLSRKILSVSIPVITVFAGFTYFRMTPLVLVPIAILLILNGRAKTPGYIIVLTVLQFLYGAAWLELLILRIALNRILQLDVPNLTVEVNESYPPAQPSPPQPPPPQSPPPQSPLPQSPPPGTGEPVLIQFSGGMGCVEINIIHDPVEDTEEYKQAMERIRPVLYEEFKDQSRPDLCHDIWGRQKQLLQVIGIEWKTPAEMNQTITFH